ncbi:unnamed protein product [Symbiodinium microadriaticum]|nr:unnamed protein product [Symbiodinium microadriaticum]CAE7228460.1 Trank1 [Symbiodinium sp. KB8]
MAVDDEQREEIILKREGHHHEKAGELTPRLIKDLRPKVAGCYLNWQPSLNQFAAYFKRPPVAESSDKKRGPKKTKQPKMHSTARVYGGKWTQIQALSLVVAQLWRWHVKYGGDSAGKPSASQIKDAMERVLAGEVDPGDPDAPAEELPAPHVPAEDNADEAPEAHSDDSESSSSSRASSSSSDSSSSSGGKKRKKGKHKRTTKKTNKKQKKSSKAEPAAASAASAPKQKAKEASKAKTASPKAKGKSKAKAKGGIDPKKRPVPIDTSKVELKIRPEHLDMSQSVERKRRKD